MIDIRYLLLVREDKRLQDVNYKTRLVLYALSSRLDDKGGCFPSQEQISKDTNLSVRSVQRGINEAVDCGFLTRDARLGGKSNYYTFPYVDNHWQVINMKPMHHDQLAHSTEKPIRQVVRMPEPMRQVDAQNLPGSRIEHDYLADEVIPIKGNNNSLSLKPRAVRQVDRVPVDNSEWDGSTKPETKDHLNKIKKWCETKGLTPEKTREFLRINNLAHWNQVTQLCPVPDMIDNFVDLWKQNDPEGYSYVIEQRRAAERRAEEERIRRNLDKERKDG